MSSKLRFLKHDLKPLALFSHLYFAVAVATHKVPYAQKITSYDIGGKLCKLCMVAAPLILGEGGGGAKNFRPKLLGGGDLSKKLNLGGGS